MIKFNYNFSKVKKKEIFRFQKKVTKIHNFLHSFLFNKKKNDFLGWIDLHKNVNKKFIYKINSFSKKILKFSNTLIICGVGGSYLGIRAIIDLLKKKNSRLKIFYIGNSFSSEPIKELLFFLNKKSCKPFCVIISKTGKTLETLISFRIIRNFIEKKFGILESKKRFCVITDKKKSFLKIIAKKKKYKIFTIPNNIGGRFSIITTVGLLPMSIAGINIKLFIIGIIKAYRDLKSSNLKKNFSYIYAVIRHILQIKKKKDIEIFISYEKKLFYFIEWLKQLFAETEGKNGKGIFPTGAIFSTDLHSLGQYIQEGKKIFFETSINVQNNDNKIIIPYDKDNFDNINYISNKKLDYINNIVFKSTIKAHKNTGNVPNIIITIKKNNEKNLGYLVYFFLKSVAMSAYLLKINPFNQPGVEVYKNNMFNLLNKKNK